MRCACSRRLVGEVGPGRSETLMLPSSDRRVVQEQHPGGGPVHVRRVDLRGAP